MLGQFLAEGRQAVAEALSTTYVRRLLVDEAAVGAAPGSADRCRRGRRTVRNGRDQVVRRAHRYRHAAGRPGGVRCAGRFAGGCVGPGSAAGRALRPGAGPGQPRDRDPLRRRVRRRCGAGLDRLGRPVQPQDRPRDDWQPVPPADQRRGGPVRDRRGGSRSRPGDVRRGRRVRTARSTTWRPRAISPGRSCGSSATKRGDCRPSMPRCSTASPRSRCTAAPRASTSPPPPPSCSTRPLRPSARCSAPSLLRAPLRQATSSRVR